jgi:hypothetical protein
MYGCSSCMGVFIANDVGQNLLTLPFIFHLRIADCNIILDLNSDFGEEEYCKLVGHWSRKIYFCVHLQVLRVSFQRNQRLMVEICKKARPFLTSLLVVDNRMAFYLNAHLSKIDFRN